VTSLTNLDLLAALYAQEMVKKGKPVTVLERLVTKTLGILQAQGVYAMMLYLLSRSGEEEKIAPIICNECYALIKELPEFSRISVPSDKKKILEFYSSNDILGKIDTLLLIRDLYEQTLIYARYGAKASKEN
jgi:hypothetical protein